LWPILRWCAAKSDSELSVIVIILDQVLESHFHGSSYRMILRRAIDEIVASLPSRRKFLGRSRRND
jgi:hypothetical protein